MTHLVVCSTPAGGHIEHACNLSAALYEQTQETVYLVSRLGAAKYLGDMPIGVRLVELFRPIPKWLGPHRLQSILSLVLENVCLTMYLLLWRNRFTTIVFEEPRFALPLLGGTILPKRTLFVHNVELHARLDGSMWVRAQERLQRFAIKRADKCVVHGHNQAESLLKMHGVTASVAPLPGRGWIEKSFGTRNPPIAPPEIDLTPMFLLCLGEIRTNKGFILAAEASQRAGHHLVVAGQPVDHAEALRLQGYPGEGLTLITRFLKPPEFEWLLLNCQAAILPYTTFEAQSGVIARAIAAKTKLLVSDLPSLLEQVADYDNILIHRANDVDSLAYSIRHVDDDIHATTRTAQGVPDYRIGWREVALVVAS